ncbi:MAG: hypothetical protein SGARI_006559, partial [Bacillariaceae sp.]
MTRQRDGSTSPFLERHFSSMKRREYERRSMLALALALLCAMPQMNAFSPSLGCIENTKSSCYHQNRHHDNSPHQTNTLLSMASTSTESASSTETPPPARRPDTVTATSEALAQQVLETMQQESVSLGRQHAEQFGLDEENDNSMTSAGLFALLDSMKKTLALGLQGYPLVIRKEQLEQAVRNNDSLLFQNFFTMKHLEQALEDDFLDAARGSTDNRKAWHITTVSNPRGDSFEEARMTYDDVLQAMEKGT